MIGVSLADMARDPWTDEENDAIVADYFAMLKAELGGRKYNKTKHRKNLQQRVGRGESSIEFKHQNISAVLRALGQPWIEGYKPRVNFQESLIAAVLRWLETRPDWLASVVEPVPERELEIRIPPTLSNQPRPRGIDRINEAARKWDAAKRDAQNRRLGRAGEELVLNYERSSLRALGCVHLADRVTWVSEEEGDGAGYDIRSFSPEGHRRLIEVKTTNGWERTPFHITRNELKTSEDRPQEWRLLRVWDFARQPKAFELSPPLETHVSLDATSYLASLR